MKNFNKISRLVAATLCASALALDATAFTLAYDVSTGLPVKWKPGDISIRLMLGADKVLSDGETYNSTVQTAAAAWTAQLGTVRFTTSTGDGTPTDSNGLNELAFASSAYGRNFDENTLAVTIAYSSNGRYTQADIFFNSTKTWDSYRGAIQAGAVDLRRVALHELGHLLGLNHPDENQQTIVPTPIMNSKVSATDSLTPDDIGGGQALYGPPGTPANDNFANATNLVFGSSTSTEYLGLTAFNTNATKESGEPNHGSNSGGHSIWWSWTAPPGGGYLSVSTAGSYIDTLLGIYTGSSVADLTTIASNDDVGDVDRAAISFISLAVKADTKYYFAVDGYQGDSGGIALNFEFVGANAPSSSPPSTPPVPPTNPTAPTFVTQPADRTAVVGGVASFSAMASGSYPLYYQWNFEGRPIPGAQNSTYVIRNVQSSHAGSYSVTVTNSVGSLTSNTAKLTVNSAVVAPTPTTPRTPSTAAGGGAPSTWFVLLLAALLCTRLRSTHDR